MVLEIQLLIHAFQKVVAPCFCELGPHESRKNACILRTMQLIQMGLVALRWWEPTHSNDINIVGLICSFGCPQWNFTVWTLGERPTQHFSNILQHPRQLGKQISGVQQQSLVASQWCKNLAARCFQEGTGNDVRKYMIGRNVSDSHIKLIALAEAGIGTQTPFFSCQIQWAQPSFPYFSVYVCPIIGGVWVLIAYSILFNQLCQPSKQLLFCKS